MLLSSCSTKKATFINKTYHNVNAHYNVWWNGNESLKEAVKALQKENKDDYTQILSAYQLGTREQAMGQNTALDRAIEKGNKGAKKHSIFVKGQEHVKWVQNCYTLIAKAQYYKHDYAMSASTFRFINSQYKDSKQANEALIWMARCLLQEEQYSLAEGNLDRLKLLIESGKASSSLKFDMYVAYSELYLKQKKYPNALKYLDLAVDERGNRKIDTRLYFIMGQIYQETKKKNTAVKYYQKVLKRSTAYEMEFNARINMASCYNSRQGSASEILKSLAKMLKDSKNKEYKDQIYYAMGEVSMSEKNATKACEYWALSVEESAGNNAQKTKSALILANTYYDLFEDYVQAENYYKIALATMKPDYPNYDKIKSREDMLSALVENIKTVNRLDTLLIFSEMSPADQNRFAEKKIAEYKAAEQAKIEKEMAKQESQAGGIASQNLKGNWYFYNATTVQRGKESFVKTWGRRMLEDNWRLSDKEITFSTPQETELAKNPEGASTAKQDSASGKEDQNISSSNANNPASKDYYFSQILRTPAQKDTAKNTICTSLLSMAFIYNDGLKNEKNAIESLLKLVQQYPEYEGILSAYYLLYRIYDRKGETPNANYYKNLILRGFPDSDYANLIRDENYYKEMLAREKLPEKEYEATFLAFTKGHYSDVLSLAQKGNETYRDPVLMPKYAYLTAFASGKLYGKEVLIKKLEELIAKYPAAEITPKAKEQLALLKSGKINFTTAAQDGMPSSQESHVSETPVEQEAATETTPTETVTDSKEQQLEKEAEVYRYRENQTHYFVILANSSKVDANQMKYDLSDFNKEFFSSLGLKISSFLFTTTEEVLMVQQFENAKTAMEYYNFVRKRHELFKKYPAQDIRAFVISAQNYPTFYNMKNIEVYEYFFNKNYVK